MYNDSSEWSEAIEKLTLNFGEIERNTYFWIESQPDDNIEVINDSKQKLYCRLLRVISLLKEKN